MPSQPVWQPENPFDAIIFDCDGTLCDIEGIDELAIQNQVGEAVKTITANAMSQSGINPEIYRQRLELVKPTQEQVVKLGELYIAHLEPESQEVIRILQRLKKSIYIVSAGLKMAIDSLGGYLTIPSSHIYAVDLSFDEQGHYLDFDHHSLLTKHDGKREVVKTLSKKHNIIAYIGDGMNDLIAKDLVTRFIGYGGAYYRQQIASLCDYYIKSKSFAPLLPLLLTDNDVKRLLPTERIIYQKGLQEIGQREA